MNREEIIEADRSSIWHPYTQEKKYHEDRPPLVVSRAEGFHLYDEDGKAYLDGNASWWTNYFGHSHPELIEALTQQANSLAHVSLAGITHEPAAKLAKKICELSPEGLTRVFFSDNGSTAVEVALKMAFHYQKLKGRDRKEFVSLEKAFHGETIGCVSVGGVDLFHKIYSPLLFPVHHLPSPGLMELEEAWEKAEKFLRKNAHKLCAFILEPLVQGVGGMLMYSEQYLRRLSTLLKELDILLIADEVFTGLGRTGKFWAVDHAEICPDFICSSKGITGGLLPFALTLTTKEVYRAFYGEGKDAFYYGHTFAGNPLGCAVAIKVLDLVSKELPEIPKRAEFFKEKMESFRELPRVVDIRCKGLIAAVELEGDGYLDQVGWKIYDLALKKGLFARPLGNTLYLLPMLNMPMSTIGDLVEILKDSAKNVL